MAEPRKVDISLLQFVFPITLVFSLIFPGKSIINPRSSFCNRFFMDVSLVAEPVNAASTQGLGLPKFLLRRQKRNNSHLSISAVLFAVDALARPAVKSNYTRTARRTLVRKKRRARRRSFSDDFEGSEEDDGFFGDDLFSSGGSGGGGGWNYGGFGGHNWDSSSSSSSDPAFDFVYEVICWIALSNCVHFAFKKIVRIMADGIGDAEREKDPMRLAPIC